MSHPCNLDSGAAPLLLLDTAAPDHSVPVLAAEEQVLDMARVSLRIPEHSIWTQLVATFLISCLALHLHIACQVLLLPKVVKTKQGTSSKGQDKEDKQEEDETFSFDTFDMLKYNSVLAVVF